MLWEFLIQGSMIGISLQQNQLHASQGCMAMDQFETESIKPFKAYFQAYAVSVKNTCYDLHFIIDVKMIKMCISSKHCHSIRMKHAVIRYLLPPFSLHHCSGLSIHKVRSCWKLIMLTCIVKHVWPQSTVYTRTNYCLG